MSLLSHPLRQVMVVSLTSWMWQTVRTPAPTDDAVQETPRPTTPTTSARAQPREVRVLLEEAVSFLESTRGEITLTTASQSFPSSRTLPRCPHRIPSS